MILFLTKVFRPWVDERDSGNRVSKLDYSTEGHRDFVLNPYFITDLLVHASGSTFKYSDNIGDRREKWSNVICDKTVAQIITIADTAAHTNAITLPIHKNNNPEKDTVDTTIAWATIAYAVRYNPDPEHHCWVVYDRGSFRRVEVLCHLALEDIVDLVRSGTTTSTFSTVPDFFD
jgi:hypothetical protein